MSAIGPKRTSLVALHMSAFGGKADMTLCGNPLLRASGVNDTYRMYLLARRDGVDFNLAAIGDDFNIPYKGPFAPDYMQALFEHGYQKGRAGYAWQKTPPGYVN